MKKFTHEEILRSIKGNLIISCQALENEPLYSSKGGIMPLLAKAALLGGATAIRANTGRDIKEIKSVVELPVIGLKKRVYEGFEQYITPTLLEVKEIVEAGAEIVAIDFTDRNRIDGKTREQFVSEIRNKYDILIMADISNYAEGIEANRLDVDFIGTTLSGYTSYTKNDNGPNIQLVRKLSKNCQVPIIAEGRYSEPIQAKKALQNGAYAVVIGGAITRPHEITRRFVNYIKES